MQNIINTVLNNCEDVTLAHNFNEVEYYVSRSLLAAVYDCFNMRAQDYIRRYKMKYVTEYYYEELDWFRLETVWNKRDDEDVVYNDCIDAIPSPNHPYIQICTYKDLYDIFIDYNPKNKCFDVRSIMLAILGFISGQIESRDVYVSGPKCNSKKVLHLAMFPSIHSMLDHKFAIIITDDPFLGEACLGYRSPVEIID